MDVGNAVYWYVAFVMSTTAHEAAHAGAAYLGGDPTAYEGGQVSLNPLPHMQREPVGMLLMPVVSLFFAGWAFGWASTPYDPIWEARHPRRAAWMAAAGPAANFAIALVAFGLLQWGLAQGTFVAPERIGFSMLVTSADPVMANAGTFLSILVILNSILGIFNLIPVPPLDGASAIGLFAPAESVLRFRESLQSGGIGALLFILVFLYFGRIVVAPLFEVVVRLLHPEFVYF